MPVYKYQAVTANGQPASGELDADHQKDLAQKLSSQGLFLTSCRLAQPSGASSNGLHRMWTFCWGAFRSPHRLVRQSAYVVAIIGALILFRLWYAVVAVFTQSGRGRASIFASHTPQDLNTLLQKIKPDMKRQDVEQLLPEQAPIPQRADQTVYMFDSKWAVIVNYGVGRESRAQPTDTVIDPPRWRVRWW